MELGRLEFASELSFPPQPAATAKMIVEITDRAGEERILKDTQTPIAPPWETLMKQSWSKVLGKDRFFCRWTNE